MVHDSVVCPRCITVSDKGSLITCFVLLCDIFHFKESRKAESNSNQTDNMWVPWNIFLKAYVNKDKLHAFQSQFFLSRSIQMSKDLLCMGYWPNVRSRWLTIGQVLFLRVYIYLDEVEVLKLAKKWTRPVSSYLDRANLVNKGFIIWLSGKLCLRDKAGSPERTRWLHLARLGSQSKRATWVT